MARERDPLKRKAKQEAMPDDILAKNAQLLLERQLRMVWRINELKCDAPPSERDRSDDTGHHPQGIDPPSVRLLFRLWERYHRLNADPELVAESNQIMNQITKLTGDLEETKNKAFQQILQVVEHKQRAKEHTEKMRIAAQIRGLDPANLTNEALEALAESQPAESTGFIEEQSGPGNSEEDTGEPS